MKRANVARIMRTLLACSLRIQWPFVRGEPRGLLAVLKD